MRALAYSAFREPLRVVDLPVPKPPPGGAVVAVEASGLCRSDWHGWMGHDPDVAAFPHVPGHEFAGRVAAIGEGVRSFSAGDRVTAPFVQGCGACAWCRRGDAQVCPDQRQPGFTDPGSFAEYVVVHAADLNLVRLPALVSAVQAAGLGCRVATAFRAVVQRARVGSGERVAIFGCGGVGLAAVAIATALGADVVAVDPSPAARRRAADLGARWTVEPDGDVVTRIRDLTGGVEVGLDCLGSTATCRQSVLSLTRRGRHVQVGLLPASLGTPEVPMGRVIGWELDVLGSHGMAAAGYPELLEWVADGRLRLDELIAPGPPLTLEQAATALALMGGRSWPGIAVLDPRG